MDRIPNETGPISILLILFILFILSRTLNATSRNTVRFPRKLGSFFPSFSRYGMAVLHNLDFVFGQAVEVIDEPVGLGVGGGDLAGERGLLRRGRAAADVLCCHHLHAGRISELLE
jgi:hypothetical protein